MLKTPRTSDRRRDEHSHPEVCWHGDHLWAGVYSITACGENESSNAKESFGDPANREVPRARRNYRSSLYGGTQPAGRTLPSSSKRVVLSPHRLRRKSRQKRLEKATGGRCGGPHDRTCQLRRRNSRREPSWEPLELLGRRNVTARRTAIRRRRSSGHSQPRNGGS